ncbi:hypothetical protein D3C73_1499070 [compost metagenome]
MSPLELDVIHLDESTQQAIEPEQTGPLGLFLQPGLDIGKCAVVETIGTDLLITPGRGLEVVQLHQSEDHIRVMRSCFDKRQSVHAVEIHPGKLRLS